jgi:DNA-binding transcriptional regulator YiaG
VHWRSSNTPKYDKKQEANVSQAVLAALMNVAVSTVNQWERDGAALKLLHVVRRGGIGVLR